MYGNGNAAGHVGLQTVRRTERRAEDLVPTSAGADTGTGTERKRERGEGATTMFVVGTRSGLKGASRGSES